MQAPRPTTLVPTLTAPVLARALDLLATTRRAWQVEGAVDALSPSATVRSAADRRRVADEIGRLVSRVWRYANAPLRADMLACLLRPLGTLSLVGVASGAFAALLQRDGAAPVTIPVEAALRYSSEQILELALFVHEVHPGTLAQLAALLSDGAIGAAALSASALVLLYRRLRWMPEASLARSQPGLPAVAAASAHAGAAGRR